MEPQRPSQYPFLRMQPFPPSRDVRNAPLPPPPYSAPSSASHHNPTPVYDPFRNRDSDAQRRTQTPPFSTQSQGANGVDYTRQQYTGASGKLHGVAHDTHMRHSGYGSGSLFGSKGENVRGHVDGEDTATYSRRPQNGALSQQHQPALAVTPSASSSSSASTTSIFKHGSGYPMSYASQHQPRRRSLGGGSPPRIYGSAPDQAAPPPPPPPPPPPFTTRQMPPPLSPQHYQPHNMFPPPSSRGPTSVVSNPGARDLPSISSLPRPGSSMSISSMLGSDSERPSRDSAPSVPVLVTPVSSPASTTVAAFSPQQLVFRKEALDNAQAKRSRTPDGNVAKGGTRAMRAYSGGTPHLVNKLSGGSPSEVYRFGPPLRAQPSSEISIFSRDAQVPNASSLYAQQARRTSLGTIPQRPNSQPVSYTMPPRSQYEGRPLPSDPAHTLSSKDCIQVTSSEPDGFGRFTTGNRTAVENIEEQERRLREEADGVKLNSSHFDSGGRHVTSYESQPISGVHEVDNKRDGQTSWNKEDQQRRPNETRRLGQYQAPEAQSSNFDFRKYLSTSQSPFTAGSLRVLQATRQLGGPPSQLHDHARPIAQHTLATPNESSATDRLNHDTSRVGADGLYRASTSTAIEGHQPKGSEESQHQQQHHRGLLNVAADNMKRGGRISPLPQAVQGAQSQMSGPAGEPGIKSEFGRMFSGIGSGVGSAMAMAGMVGSGTPTPSGPSPVKRDERPQRSPFKASDDMTAAKLPRVTSRGGRKSRKIKEEESKLDGESGDGRGTPQLKSARGGKRTRHSHHHHLYQHGHQHGHHHHHHHHHKADDDVASNVPVQPVNTPFSSFNAFRRTATPTQNRSITPSPVTMHHHHHHHHHHTGKAASAPNAPILHKPTITVLSQALLASVAHLPRHHLGSTLYSPKIQLPSSTASHEEAKFGYVTTPSALPRFQGKENCTYTVRVPRFYLAREEREVICRRRAVWGTDVYTDDSDPLAAVMHSGWVRGEWGEEVDISMLDLCINDSMTASSKTTKAGLEPQSILTAPPRGGPMMPRAGKDLHITLLVLPQLQNYASTVAYGVKSRAWGGNHDGMSFKIEKIAWVDEGIGKGEERGGEARRKRLRAMVETRTMAAGPGLQLRITAPGSIRVIPAKVAVA